MKSKRYRPDQDKIRKLYQSRKEEKARSRWGTQSFTESRESYNWAAKHEAMVLKLNGTIPDYIITLHYAEVMSVARIQYLWAKHSRRMKDAGIVGRATIEITKDERRINPVNRVHYHIVVKDTRTRDELRELVRNICLCEMKPSSFEVECIPMDEKKGGWSRYLWYFVKYKMKSNFLFQPGLYLNKFYTINESRWWTHQDGTSRTKGSIENEMKAHRKKQNLERDIRQWFEHSKDEWVKAQSQHPSSSRKVGYGRPHPANPEQLKATLDNESEMTLFDWFNALKGMPIMFGTVLPPWWKKLLCHRRKCIDVKNAIYERLRKSEDIYIILGLEIYHDL